MDWMDGSDFIIRHQAFTTLEGKTEGLSGFPRHMFCRVCRLVGEQVPRGESEIDNGRGWKRIMVLLELESIGTCTS